MADVTGASALDLAPSGRGDLVQQLNEASRRHRWGRWALAAAIVLLFVKPPVGPILALLASPGVAWLFVNDRARRSVVVFYDVNDDAADWFERLMSECVEVARMSRRWRINTAGDVRTTYQYKVNSGASRVVSRAEAQVTTTGPMQLKTNIAVPTIRSGKHALHFLPDRLLISDGKSFSDVSYAALNASSHNGRFIESDRPPKDAVRVDTTWQYVNVKGGPDQRYNNNLQLPVMLYGNLELVSPSGLNWLLQCSRQDGFAGLERTLDAAPAELDQTAETPAETTATTGTAAPAASAASVGDGAGTETVGAYYVGVDHTGAFRRSIVITDASETADSSATTGRNSDGDATNERL